MIFTAFAWSRAVTQPIERDAIYRRRRFSRDVIETCVRWYLTYRLSYRDLVALMAERDVRVAHPTIMRWIFRYVPEYERHMSAVTATGYGVTVHQLALACKPSSGFPGLEGANMQPCVRHGRRPPQ